MFQGARTKFEGDVQGVLFQAKLLYMHCIHLYKGDAAVSLSGGLA